MTKSFKSLHQQVTVYLCLAFTLGAPARRTFSENTLVMSQLLFSDLTNPGLSSEGIPTRDTPKHFETMRGPNLPSCFRITDAHSARPRISYWRWGKKSNSSFLWAGSGDLLIDLRCASDAPCVDGYLMAPCELVLAVMTCEFNSAKSYCMSARNKDLRNAPRLAHLWFHTSFTTGAALT